MRHPLMEQRFTTSAARAFFHARQRVRVTGTLRALKQLADHQHSIGAIAIHPQQQLLIAQTHGFSQVHEVLH